MENRTVRPPANPPQNPNRPERLFGLPGAESMYLSIAELLAIADPESPVQIEERAIVDPIEHFPVPDLITEWIGEWLGDNELDEYGYENAVEALNHADVLALLSRAMQTAASKMTYFMADELVGRWTAVWVEGEDRWEVRKVEEIAKEERRGEENEEEGKPPEPGYEDGKLVCTCGGRLHYEGYYVPPDLPGFGAYTCTKCGMEWHDIEGQGWENDEEDL